MFLFFLARSRSQQNGQVDVVVTEDSDLMVFGCRVLCKVNKDCASGMEFDMRAAR